MMHLSNHYFKTQWSCRATRHPEPINFETADEYAKHLFSEHSHSYSELPPIVRYNNREVARKLDAKVLPSCPMCGISIESFGLDVDQLCRHIAQELFDYALLAIPDKAPRPPSHDKGNQQKATKKGSYQGCCGVLSETMEAQEKEHEAANLYRRLDVLRVTEQWSV